MSRICSAFVVLAATAAGGCCAPGSPCWQNNYPNMIGYTYPNWENRQPLITPPNPPQDGLQYGYVPQIHAGTEYIDNTGVPNGTTTAPSFAPQGSGTRVPTQLTPGSTATTDNWVPRSNSRTR